MRIVIPALLALAATPVAAQVESRPPTDGSGVERTTLAPGEARAFTLAPGNNHQLLRPAALDAKGAVTVRYVTDGGVSQVVAVNRTGHPLTFTVLADPDGDGGYTPAGDVSVAGDGTPGGRRWPTMLGTINVGDFVGGPHGANPHAPSGE